MRGCGAGGEAFIAVERRWRLGGMRRRPAAEIMAVGAGVNGGRGSARRRDASGRRRPLQASLCRGRRRLYGVNGGRGGVRAHGIGGGRETCGVCGRVTGRRSVRARPMAPAWRSPTRRARAGGCTARGGLARRVGRPGRVRGEREAESRRGKSRPGAGSGPGREQGRGGWWRGRAVRSRGRGPGRCSAAFGKEGGEGRKERREEKKEKEEKKRKEKEKGKKKKKKEGKEKGKREGERGPRRDHGADRGAGRPRLASGRARARRAGRGETGCWIRVSGLWGIGSPGGTGRIPENWG